MNEFLVVLFFLAGAANRAAEIVKRTIVTRFPDTNPDAVSLVALLTSVAAGILGALSLNANLFAFLPTDSYLAGVPPLVGVVLTGCAAGFGGEGLHALLDLIYGKRDELQARAELNWTAATAETNTPPDAAG
jgi:hypothetical protein